MRVASPRALHWCCAPAASMRSSACPLRPGRQPKLPRVARRSRSSLRRWRRRVRRRCLRLRVVCDRRCARRCRRRHRIKAILSTPGTKVVRVCVCQTHRVSGGEGAARVLHRRGCVNTFPVATSAPPPTKRLWGYLEGRSTRVGGCPALLAPDNGWRQQGYAL